ncbi:MAG: SDR family oxidoreductase [Candidatus Diapherotrites archaeon]|nr:SDR family oxidoreductase [Candidatus Diapherotrites archaeon]
MKVLITGGNGFLGKKITNIFSENLINVVCTHRIREYGHVPLDVTDKKAVLKTIKKYAPDVVIHTAAITKVDWCEIHEKETYKVNLIGTENIAQACKLSSAILAFISTDYVFDGTKKGKYVESSRTNPINVYGKSKLEAEKFIQNYLDNFLICRVTVLYGYNDKNDKLCYPMHVIKSLSEKKPFYCFAEQYSNPTLINDIGKGLLKLLENGQKGIFNMTGGENINRFEFAKKIAKVFDLDSSLLIKSSWKNFNVKAKRPLFLDIDLSKLRKQKIQMSNVYNGLLQMKNDMIQKSEPIFPQKK